MSITFTPTGTKMAKNIEQFDEYTGRIFAHLYENFPVPVSLSPRNFLDCGSISISADEYVYTTDEAKIFLATAKWLVMTGYIHSKGEKKSYISEAVLTAKGLEILKATPSSVVGGPSLGDKLATAAKEEGREALRSLVSEALSLGARLISPLVGLSS
ncbi:hypothetical protein EX349_29140 [Pseudomonas protegens]|uniref:hypothetical protein n=1 Tax=Pseudomonas protegens TaxID=380021 RepID=UPI0013724CCE|nr:hypothetical protein [Pseudomonas protegens]NAN55260.1 hypothetical protein [Pseudomonas protegens]NUE77283.1 hypothetical protein [Pseudomonas protegens]